MGALIKADTQNGWRKFYWIQVGLWGPTAIRLFVGYRPLRDTRDSITSHSSKSYATWILLGLHFLQLV
ncbi:uncharacterized protein Z518_08894 [Rhinocladiella mackenziei CBS 650.93]|uniref:Uncharacterized protein n=1 Tax=Rhinocladiella mackenziei CBS 650.93 TaxID=1442369 RepID=A0A0D2I5U7_9EURO|nr:uncharacterized protein Z518_08894 [Rhinocladiella mackenziei CBS 650.93]KIX01169.1 hypothetical protein Z518_08894 [Rhinocladiella mackenziei CBS 650.93]